MKNELIWVVDDDPIFRLVFTMTLKKCYPGFTVSEFEDGKAACDSFKKRMDSNQNLPHRIFMDINMPVMNGWECLQKIQSIVDVNPDIKPAIYVVSSSINPEDERKAITYDVTSAYLVKPLTVDVFKELFG